MCIFVRELAIRAHIALDDVRMLHEAASVGSRELCDLACEWMIAYSNDFKQNIILTNAALADNRDLCVFARENGATAFGDMLICAASRGNMRLVNLAIEWAAPYTEARECERKEAKARDAAAAKIIREDQGQMDAAFIERAYAARYAAAKELARAESRALNPSKVFYEAIELNRHEVCDRMIQLYGHKLNYNKALGHVTCISMARYLCDRGATNIRLLMNHVSNIGGPHNSRLCNLCAFMREHGVSV
jgi:hypothetical protein